MMVVNNKRLLGLGSLYISNVRRRCVGYNTRIMSEFPLIAV